MIIVELKVDHFGKLKGKTIPLRPGMNVITGDNESGKTTIAAFVKGVFYGLNAEEYDRFYPRKDDGVFGGSIAVLQNGARYQISRNFVEGGRLQVEKEDGTRISNPDRWLSEALSGLTEEQFLATGFTSQAAFLRDAGVWEETPEKTAAADRSRDIREQAKAAGKKLERQRVICESQMKDGVEAERDAVKEAIRTQEKTVAALEQEIPEKETELQQMNNALAEESEAVARANQEKKDLLRADMLEKKNALAAYTDKAERMADRGNVMGVILMVLGILGGVATYFFCTSEKITLEHDLLIWAIVAGAAAALLFIAGIVLSIVYASERKKAKKALSTRCELHDFADEAERAYQYYLNHPEEGRVLIPNQADKERQIAEMQDAVAHSKEALSEAGAALDGLRTEESRLEAELRKQADLRTDLRALEAAITEFRALSRDDSEALYTALTEKANEYLTLLKVEAPVYIRLQDDMLYADYEGKPVQVESLSTSTLQSVFLAVRMALFDKFDPNKNVLVILDDAFTNFDAARMKTAMSLVRASGRQTLLLTCQPRERENVNC